MLSKSSPYTVSAEDLAAMASCDTSTALSVDATVITLGMVGNLARAYRQLLGITGVEPTFKISASEVQETAEMVKGASVLRHIHDLQCSCGSGASECTTEGVAQTLLQAAESLLAGKPWNISFEDGWICVDHSFLLQEETHNAQ